MKKLTVTFLKTLIVIISNCFAFTNYAQTTLTEREYVATIETLFNEHKTKLEKIIDEDSNHKYNDWRESIGHYARYALKDLENVRTFYLNPERLSMDWDVEGWGDNRPYNKRGTRPDYVAHGLYIVKKEIDGKFIYNIYREQPIPTPPSKYRETALFSFCDPSGRKINVWGKLYTLEQLKANLLPHKNRDTRLRRPEKRYWTSTQIGRTHACLELDGLGPNEYMEYGLSDNDIAINHYAVEISLSTLLDWYKKALDKLMENVNKMQAKLDLSATTALNKLKEADKTNRLAILLTETAEKVKSDKSLFDYQIIETPTSYEINVIANGNTLKFVKDFWTDLDNLGSSYSNSYNKIKISGKYFEYRAAPTDEENESHIRDLIYAISTNAQSALNIFLKSMFGSKKPISCNIENGNWFRIYGVDLKDRYGTGIVMPCLYTDMKKGSSIYSMSISKNDFSIKDNLKNTGYNIKLKK